MVNLPEKRESTVYVRVKPVNKNWIERAAKAAGVSVSVLLDHLIETARLGK